MSAEPIPLATADAQPAKPIKLPSIRQAGAWTKTTDALLEALEAEERAAMVVFEAARERVKAARSAANAVRQVRALVVPAQPSANGHGRIELGPDHPDFVASPSKRWARDHDACRICGTTSVKHASHGRCASCATHFGKTGQERITTREANAS